jgi:hypothetical protein
VNIIKKIGIFAVLTVAGVAIASLYGALHNQVSYSVSSEYFTRFKFEQFDIPSSLPERIGAGFVGIQASWWMGLPIGIILALVGFIHKDANSMLRFTLQSFAVVATVTLAVGIIGLLYGWFYLSTQPLSEFSDWYIPSDLTSQSAFIAAGSMHNFSYLGGVIGMFFGAWWQIRSRRRRLLAKNAG